MFAIAIAVLAAAVPLAPQVPLASATSMRSPAVAAPAVRLVDPPEELLATAYAAQARGDLATAHREFTRIIRRQRADGILSVQASYGAAHVLTLQRKFRDAADVLDQLAADANLLGDADTEARVLLDVVSLKLHHRRRDAARPDAERLRALVTDVRLTADTRRLIQSRFG